MRPHNVSEADWLEYNALFFAEHFLGHKNYQRLLGQREKRLWESVDRYAASNPPADKFEVIEHQGDEEPLYHPYKPEVFRGVAKDWPCVTKWTFDFFAEKYGDKEVSLTNNRGLVSKGQNPLVNNGMATAFETMKLREYIAQLKTGTPKYLKFSQMIHESSDLQEDFNVEWLLKFHRSHEFKKLFFLFIGGAGTATPIHTALPPTVFVQIQGTKKWTFYPANDRLFLGVRPDRRSYYFTDANPGDSDDPNFPLLKHAQPQEVLVHAGDVVWFPSCVWHQVQNVSDSIGVAYKFFDIPSALKASKMLTSLFFCATKPTLIQSSIVAKITKREYIFNAPQRY
ncbi:MAG TPA: cupin-like domain-containing protein [Candidatus Binatia bacterium]|nr:cupin-like domain-containing protein [Candidatus Binatia bacterium]